MHPESTDAKARPRVTQLLEQLGEDATPPSADDLLPLVYDELRRLAGSYLQRERAGHTLQPTALVHEAYERLVDQTRVEWQGRSHFFAVAAIAMRRLLSSHARDAGRQKRGGGQRAVTLDEVAAPIAGEEIDFEDLLALEEAMRKLERFDARAARIVELRFFAGMTSADAAKYLGVSKRTADADWNHARAWLLRELSANGP